VAVAREAAALVARGRASAGEHVDVKSSPVDVVTAVDRASEELIVSRLLAARPDDGILGEEGAARPGSSGVRWVVDPIDGTVNFHYDLPQYAVSVAAERDGVVVAGVVLNVATGTEYVAHLADPGAPAVATRDGRPLAVRGPAPLHQRLVATGFSYDAELRELQARALVGLIGRVRDVRRLGSCALDLCHVAEGSLDGYVEEGTNLWDHAAGGLVATVAGARVGTLPGAGGRTLLVCAPEHGYDELLSAVRDAGFAATPAGE
jgi:myo-inositol-1(or 4)-monophosphatase